MIDHLSATEIKKKFEEGTFSAEAIVQACVSRIEQEDEKIGAFLTLLKERALAKARDLDIKRQKGGSLGKLAGIPVALKDNIHLKGELTTCGSKFLENYRAPFDATVSRLLEEEDALIIGKTNLDEFAMGSTTENSAFKETSNPWDLSCCPGGSSGGSAAAVAARLCPVALGSDTGGSIRQPASFCGVVGFKPTYGRVSRYGLVAFASSMDQIGPIATNVADAALFMEVLGVPCEKDATSLQVKSSPYELTRSLKGVRVGVPWTFLEGLKQKPKEVFLQALETFKALGAILVDIDLSILKYSLSTYYILATAEASTNLARFDGIRYGKRSEKASNLEQVYALSKEDGFGKEVKRRILLGTYVLSKGYQDAYYKKGQRIRTLIIQGFQKAFSECDVISLPTTPSTTFKKGALKEPLDMYLEDIYTIGINLAGVPAISIPSGFSHDDKPFGLQIIGPQKEDAKVFQVAYAFEQATPYHERRPKTR